MSISINSTTPAATDPNPVAIAAKKTEVSTDQFLQLLVAQVKNQDPLNPTDGVQFLTQLAQFTQLEQTIGIRSDLGDITDELKLQNPTTTPAPETGSTDKETPGAINV
ncbi:MAG: hypothetical protein H7Y20_15725 [Bryobacteraceae bacterium]|nr:hypothetical protein [Bryobacteraceae bacterium]